MHWRGHELSLGVAVTGTDVAWTRDLCASVDPGRILALKRNFDECTLIVSVDRVDDLRGVLKKLEGYQCFWQRHHEQWRGQLKLVQIIIPAEDQANGDVKTEAAVSDLAHKLNGTYGALGNSAVIIHYSPLSDEDYVTLLQAADVYLNCSERDSIPLSVLDYAICRQTASNNAATPYILSEFVELANNLPGCSRINPWDPQQIASALHEALAHGKVGEHEEIGEREAKAQYRTRILLRYAAMFDARQWADRLMVLALGQKKFAGEPSPACLDFAQLKCDYDAAHRRIFFLDYDV
jgi:trehalose 6-phosphate synthase